MLLTFDTQAQIHRIYEEWFLRKNEKLQKGAIQRIKRFFEGHFLPYFSKYDKDRSIISSLNINDVTHRDVIDIVIKFEKTSSPDSARRAFWLIRDFWRYAFNIGLLKANPLSD
ncbi:hypothetical protein, partial [Helicobacter sp. 13S00482-2]|uniref:phage integrase central domain-containing protein n=2 Tax=Helicobacter sp. 13S00482-2 TaxID=1476200 RepID=UPI00117B2CE8